MKRYFLEVKYRGDNYSGFQVQKNAPSVQAEVERALKIFFSQTITLTGSSRTDAGVHALQNYFHFDIDADLRTDILYNLNSIISRDIALVNLIPVNAEAHCRFDAESRTYRYVVYQKKNPFLSDTAYYFPYTLDLGLMQAAAEIVVGEKDFTTFSKRNTQVKNFVCNVSQSLWQQTADCYVYRVRANRFLRGMVRGLVGTMLQVGRRKVSVEQFIEIIESKDCKLADFSVPGKGLMLEQVSFPAEYFQRPSEV